MTREIQRMRWRCRRGLLELDIVLDSFVRLHHEGLSTDDLDQFDRLLDYPDNDLLDLIFGRIQPHDDNTQQILRKLQNALPEVTV
jgi:antitoxin CptB